MLDTTQSWHGQTDYQGETPFSSGGSLTKKRPQLDVLLTRPQHELLCTKSAFPAFVAGYGSGKTQGLVLRSLYYKRKYMPLNFAYYMPTFDIVRTTGIPRFEEILSEWQVSYKLNKSTAEILLWEGGKIIFRSMDTPHRIIAYEVADSAVDELDTLKELDARNCWYKIVARNRQKKPDKAKNTIAVGTTPEGFRFVYQQWKKQVEEWIKKGLPTNGYELIKASTYSNARNLGADTIPNLLALYPPNLILAYIEGEFVNLTGGTVYNEFSRLANGTKATIQPGEVLHIGMDFNVTKMAAIVHVIRENRPYALAELTKVYDTPTMINDINRRFPNHQKVIYPDATGDNRKSVRASESDLSLLRLPNPKTGHPGFSVINDASNPPVKDRVLAMNCAFNGGGQRKYFVNVDLCPDYAASLEHQIWDDKGEPDKKSGHDHTNDAGGYFIYQRFPVVRQTTYLTPTKGH